MLNSESRPAISQLSTQQLAAMPAGALVSAQYEYHTAAGSMSAEKDLALCDADGGAFQLALPTVNDAILGKAYIVRETGGTNAVTLTTPGSETIDGATTFVVAAGTSACVIMVMTAAGVKSWVSVANAGSGGTGFLVDGVGTVELTNMAAESVDSDQYVDGSIDLAHMSANSVDSDQYVDGSIDTVHIADAQITPAKMLGAVVAPAADAACAILNTTTEINLTVTAAPTVVISTTSSVAGQEIFIRAMAVAGGGSYTLAVTGGTLTFNSTGEAAIIRRNGANSAWLVYSLCASSSTGANIATIV